MYNKKAFHEENAPPLSIFNTASWVILIVFLIALVAARFVQLGAIPNGLYWDEASYAYNAWSILQTGADEWGEKTPLFLQAFGEYKPALLSYLQIPFLSAMGLTETATRLPVALLGILSLAGWFLVLKGLGAFSSAGKQQLFCIITSVVWLASAPWHFHYSRAAFDPMVSFSFLLLGYGLFVQKKPWQQWAGIFSLILAAYTYTSARLFVPLLFILHVWIYEPHLIRAWKQHAQRVLQIGALVGALSALLFFTAFSNIGTRAHDVFILKAPQIESSTNEDLYRSTVLNIPLKRLFSNKILTSAETIIENYISHFDITFLFFNQHLSPRHGFSKHGNLLLISLPFLVTGLVSMKRKNKTDMLFLFWLLASPAAAALTTDIPHSGRALLMLPSLVYFITKGLLFIFQKLEPITRPPVLSAIFSTVTLGLLIYNTGLYFVDMYRFFPEESYVSWQGRSRDVVYYLNSLPLEKYDQVLVSKALLESYISYAVYAHVDPHYMQSIRHEGEPHVFGNITLTPKDSICNLLTPHTLFISSYPYFSSLPNNPSDEEVPLYIDTLIPFNRFHAQQPFGYVYDTNLISENEKNLLQPRCAVR